MKSSHRGNERRAAGGFVTVKSNRITQDCTIGIALNNGEDSLAFGAFRHVADTGNGNAHICSVMSDLDNLAAMRGGVSKADNAPFIFFKCHNCLPFSIFIVRLLVVGTTPTKYGASNSADKFSGTVFIRSTG
jgi:hypothetical protein